MIIIPLFITLIVDIFKYIVLFIVFRIFPLN